MLCLKQEPPSVAQRLRDAPFGEENRDGAKKTKIIALNVALKWWCGIEMVWHRNGVIHFLWWRVYHQFFEFRRTWAEIEDFQAPVVGAPSF